jgi:hypothetical protein
VATPSKISWVSSRMPGSAEQFTENATVQAYRKSSTSLDESMDDGELIGVAKYTTSGLPATRPRSRLPDDVILTLTLGFAQGKQNDLLSLFKPMTCLWILRSSASFRACCQQRVGPARNDLGDVVLLPVIHVIGTLDQSSIHATWASG